MAQVRRSERVGVKNRKKPFLFSMSQVPIVCPGHTRPVVQLHYSQETPDGVFLASACKDGKPMLRNGETGDWVGTFTGHKGAVWCCRLNSDSTKSVTASADFTVKLWDAISGGCLETLEHKHVVLSSAFSSDSKRVVSGGYEKLLYLWDIENAQEPISKFEGSTKNIRQCVFSNDDSLIISGGEDTMLRVWDVQSGKQIREICCDEHILDMDLSNEILTVVTKSKIRFYSLDYSYTLLKEVTVVPMCTVRSASLHPLKKRVAIGGEDNWVRVISVDILDGNTVSVGEGEGEGGEGGGEGGDKSVVLVVGESECVETHKGHHGGINSVRYHPSGQCYATGSDDGTIRIWSGEKKEKEEKESE